MSFFKRLFGRSAATVECPRCLGKGHVDMDDIKRLGQELRWMPGKCAYCKGKGKVDPEMVSKVRVNESYLTNNLSGSERARLINGDPAALERGVELGKKTDELIQQIRSFYFVNKLDVEQIAELYLQALPRRTSKQKAEMIDFIQRVVLESPETKN